MVKNYKLGLISVLISCSLSNAIDFQESNDPIKSLHDVAVLFRDKKFLDNESLLKSSEFIRYKKLIRSNWSNSVNLETARKAYCKEIECSDNDCAKFLGFLVSFFSSANNEETTNYPKFLFTGYIIGACNLKIDRPKKSSLVDYIVYEGNVYNKFCLNCYVNSPFNNPSICIRLQNLNIVKYELIAKKEDCFSKNIACMKKKQKQIELEIVKIVDTKKYEECIKNYANGTLRFNEISYEKINKLACIEGVEKVGIFKRKSRKKS